ncbi:MAG: hypothetical protein K1X78_00375 [Verrucomicrobiaceae bacterium]|nr:hypothetical protein [Verrucomicrobiaceae bacterium]
MNLLRGKPWLRLRRLFIGGALLSAFVYSTTRTRAPVLPAGVRKEHLHLVLAGQDVSVTMYYPPRVTEAPLVVVAHGFTRTKRYMAGWGALLAGHGFIVAVPTQPALADHALNARVLAALPDELRSGRLALLARPSQRAALAGFSMGGLTTFLAMAQRPVDAWVGLDPVGMDESWLRVAGAVNAPCAILRGEPQAWNMSGNSRRLALALHGPKFVAKVRGATHLDPESPTDILGQIACGRSDAKRRAIFESYTVAFLKAVLSDDVESRKILAGAAGDGALAEVENSLRFE